MRYFTCVLLASATIDAAAQDAPGSVHVAAAVSFPHQAALQYGSPPPFPAPGGNTIGWLVGGGLALSPRFSIEIETSRTGVMQARQAGRHDTSQASTRRDWFVSFAVKAHLPSNVRMEPMAGIVLVGNEGTYSSFSGDSRGYLPLAWNPGIVFGADFRIGGRRLALVPGVRFVFTGVPDGVRCLVAASGEPLCSERANRWEGRYPRWTQRPSVALRVNF